MSVDKKEATDFMMFTAADVRIAARVRSSRYRRFRKDVTLRSKRDSGARTEYAKIMEDGFAHWMFYGHHTGKARDLDPWFLIDLDVLRDLHGAHGDAILAVKNKANGDGTYFNVIRPGDLVRKFNRPDLIIDWEFDGLRHQLPLGA